MAGIVVKPRARIFHGHDWVYASEILKSWGDPRDGDVVQVKDGRDRLLGSAIFNSKSQIVARRFSRQRQDLDADFFQRRISQAVNYRLRRGVRADLCRLVWSESDGLPGLVVDRYGPVLVVQTLTLAMDLRKPLLVEVLRQCFGDQCAIVERNDAPIRRAEGLPLHTGVLAGQPQPVRVTVETGTPAGATLELQIDPLHGQKTGFYLDQADNYRTVARWAAGRRVLDGFANQGMFALACAKAGAASVTALEISPEAVAQLREHARCNGLAVEAVEANAFDVLRQMEQAGAQFDLVVLDPPSFTKTKGALREALRGYKELHLRAFKLLAPEGLLATFCCSHHVSATAFREMIVAALVDARKSARILQSMGQAADHPVLATLPETEYLKGFLLEMAPGR